MVNVYIPRTHTAHGTPFLCQLLLPLPYQGGDSSPSQKRTRLHTVWLGGNGRISGFWLANFEAFFYFKDLHLGNWRGWIEPKKMEVILVQMCFFVLFNWVICWFKVSIFRGYNQIGQYMLGVTFSMPVIIPTNLPRSARWEVYTPFRLVLGENHGRTKQNDHGIFGVQAWMKLIFCIKKIIADLNFWFI